MTAFTVAHSITLALATLQIVSVPARISESAIALSVVLAALNNLYPVIRGRRWTVAFGLGLIHGFGFASVLTDLLLPEGALALALAGFNLGVEAGQIAIVLAFLPLAYLLRSTWLYRRFVFMGGSSVIVVIAALLFLERSMILDSSLSTNHMRCCLLISSLIQLISRNKSLFVSSNPLEGAESRISALHPTPEGACAPPARRR